MSGKGCPFWMYRLPPGLLQMRKWLTLAWFRTVGSPGGGNLSSCPRPAEPLRSHSQALEFPLKQPSSPQSFAPPPSPSSRLSRLLAAGGFGPGRRRFGRGTHSPCKRAAQRAPEFTEVDESEAAVPAEGTPRRGDFGDVGLARNFWEMFGLERSTGEQRCLG